MARKFVATFLLRSTIEDVYGKGAIVGTENSLSENEEAVTADTLPDLIKKLNDTYRVSAGAITLSTTSDDVIILTRHETRSGNVPNNKDKAEWEKGKKRLLIVDYTIRIHIEETVDFSKMSEAELAAAAIYG